jgi:DNA-binding MarR family transcriptional regulator
VASREADPTDRRRVRVAMSARGRTVHERLAPAVEDAERRLLDDPQATALLRVVARLSGDRTGA